MGELLKNFVQHPEKLLISIFAPVYNEMQVNVFLSSLYKHANSRVQR